MPAISVQALLPQKAVLIDGFVRETRPTPGPRTRRVTSGTLDQLVCLPTQDRCTPFAVPGHRRPR